MTTVWDKLFYVFVTGATSVLKKLKLLINNNYPKRNKIFMHIYIFLFPINNLILFFGIGTVLLF